MSMIVYNAQDNGVMSIDEKIIQEEIQNRDGTRKLDVNKLVIEPHAPLTPSATLTCGGIPVPKRLELYFHYSPWYEPAHPKRSFLTFTPDPLTDIDYKDNRDVIVGLVVRANQFGLNTICGVAFSDFLEVSYPENWKWIACDEWWGDSRGMFNQLIQIMLPNEPPPRLVARLDGLGYDSKLSGYGLGYYPWSGSTRVFGCRPGYALKSIKFQMNKVVGDKLDGFKFKLTEDGYDVIRKRVRMQGFETTWEQVFPNSSGQRLTFTDQIREAPFYESDLPYAKILKYEASKDAYIQSIGWLWGSNTDDHVHTKWIPSQLGVGNIYSISSLDLSNFTRAYIQARQDGNKTKTKCCELSQTSLKYPNRQNIEVDVCRAIHLYKLNSTSFALREVDDIRAARNACSTISNSYCKGEQLTSPECKAFCARADCSDALTEHVHKLYRSGVEGKKQVLNTPEFQCYLPEECIDSLIEFHTNKGIPAPLIPRDLACLYDGCKKAPDGYTNGPRCQRNFITCIGSIDIQSLSGSIVVRDGPIEQTLRCGGSIEQEQTTKVDKNIQYETTNKKSINNAGVTQTTIIQPSTNTLYLYIALFFVLLFIGAFLFLYFNKKENS